MKYVLPHEQLQVYQKALQFAESAMGILDTWPSIAVKNEFDRASEGVVTNLVTAARHQRTDRGTYLLECSLGSVLECAACLDIAERRKLIEPSATVTAKNQLQEIARMEVGLRKAWDSSVRDEDSSYTADAPQRYFNHESLVVYQRSLDLHVLLFPILTGDAKNRRITKIDDLSTSLTLNIAEGNGRFSQRDHKSFLETSLDSATKLTAYADLIAISSDADVDACKACIREIVSMMIAMTKYLDGDED